MSDQAAQVRLDKWLWAARFFKTRSQAKTAIEGGKVHLNNARVKASKDVRVGDTLDIRRGTNEFVVRVIDLAERRGNATMAQALYEETVESIDRRETDVARRRMERAGLRVPASRPSKKGRRELRRLKEAGFDDQAIDTDDDDAGAATSTGDD